MPLWDLIEGIVLLQKYRRDKTLTVIQVLRIDSDILPVPPDVFERFVSF